MAESRGFPCPTCSEPIHVDVVRLLGGGPFFCGACGLRLDVDRTASASALETARLYQRAISQAEASGVLHAEAR